ncbi:aldo/keto reductase [Salinibacter altiplanensis]|uniref:aldo/keto reductase n=1 Tax=Salinibacter altiplanensis TaxID=1803181 RepID=UPI000C9FC8BE|nr:aldo/keto reductase [Salinibacter altiplanensis]
MQSISFANGDEMPMVGLGTWKSPPGEVYKAVKTALEAGYRHVDCAPIYKNEHEVGNALRDSFDAGTASREDVWVTSKLWNDNHHPDNVRPALEQTLDDLQLDALDLYLIHWPVALAHGVDFPESPDDFVSPEEVPLTDTWAAMEALKEDGLVRHIGVSNFSVPTLQLILDEGEVRPEMNQVEMHPYLPQPDLVSFAKSQNIPITAYSPLGSGDRPDAMKADDEPTLMANPTINEIADAHGVSPAHVLLQWGLNRGTAVIPKSTTPAHIEDNLAAADLDLSTDELQTIDTLDQNYRYLAGAAWTMEGSPYTQAGLWGE